MACSGSNVTDDIDIEPSLLSLMLRNSESQNYPTCGVALLLCFDRKMSTPLTGITPIKGFSKHVNGYNF